jgi:alpha-glucosidase/alpha-D-xyloside xylohydrolase
MKKTITRRDTLKLIGTAAAASFLHPTWVLASEDDVLVGGRAVEIRVTPISRYSARITLSQRATPSTALTADGALAPQFVSREKAGGHIVAVADNLRVKTTRTPLTFEISRPDGSPVQQLTIDQQTGAVSFPLGGAPVLGMGEGGPQFDRRGNADRMRSGQGGYRLRTHGGRVPIQWLVSTAGWALFIHTPLGGIDLTQLPPPTAAWITASTSATLIP